MLKMNTKKATWSLEEVAKKEGVSVFEVRREIANALEEGKRSSDPAVQAAWARIPHAGEEPTVEEVITYLASEVKRAKNNHRGIVS
ncbi:hypothetical protein [Oscillibacter ruminantium]|jgi:transcriptional regulator with XRE-family HTH domain